jgi:hypothetical protein
MEYQLFQSRNEKAGFILLKEILRLLVMLYDAKLSQTMADELLKGFM